MHLLHSAGTHLHSLDRRCLGKGQRIKRTYKINDSKKAKWKLLCRKERNQGLQILVQPSQDTLDVEVMNTSFLHLRYKRKHVLMYSRPAALIHIHQVLRT